MNKVTTRFECTMMLSFLLSLQCWRMIERWRPNTRSLFVLRLTFSLCLSASLFLFASHSHTHSLAAHPFSTHPFLFTIVYHGQRTVSFPVRTHCHHVSENSSACFDTAATSRVSCPYLSKSLINEFSKVCPRGLRDFYAVCKATTHASKDSKYCMCKHPNVHKKAHIKYSQSIWCH